MITDCIRITAPHFVAAVNLEDDRHTVCFAAPIVKYMMGWTWERVVKYSQSKGWKAEFI